MVRLRRWCCVMIPMTEPRRLAAHLALASRWRGPVGSLSLPPTLPARENGTYCSRERYLFAVRTGVRGWLSQKSTIAYSVNGTGSNCGELSFGRAGVDGGRVLRFYSWEREGDTG